MNRVQPSRFVRRHEAGASISNPQTYQFKIFSFLPYLPPIHNSLWPTAHVIVNIQRTELLEPTIQAALCPASD